MHFKGNFSLFCRKVIICLCLIFSICLIEKPALAYVIIPHDDKSVYEVVLTIDDFHLWHGFGGEESSTYLTSSDIKTIPDFPKLVSGPFRACKKPKSGINCATWSYGKVYGHKHNTGCLVYGPYLNMNGRGNIIGNVYVDGAQLHYDRRGGPKGPPLDPNTILFEMDLTADKGAKKLASKAISIRDLIEHRDYYSLHWGTHWLSTNGVGPLENIEVRVCRVHPRFNNLNILFTRLLLMYE